MVQTYKSAMDCNCLFILFRVRFALSELITFSLDVHYLFFLNIPNIEKEHKEFPLIMSIITIILPSFKRTCTK